MPQITTITSEALQAEIRRLLPSQRGFGIDLEATNVITPVIDLTPTAEGSALRQDLQTAASFDNCTSTLRITAGTDTLVSTPGFYRYEAQMQVNTTTGSLSNQVLFQLHNGLGGRVLHRLVNIADVNPEEPISMDVSGTIYLSAGETLQQQTVGTDAVIQSAVWPIADVYGNYINPANFTFE